MSWTSDTLTVNLDDLNAKAHNYLSTTTSFYSLRAETYAKSKAIWIDRTGNARSGLATSHSAAQSGGKGTYSIEVYHQVRYGHWLEVRWNGKYGIINKTVVAESKRFFSAAQQVMAKLFGGAS